MVGQVPAAQSGTRTWSLRAAEGGRGCGARAGHTSLIDSRERGALLAPLLVVLAQLGAAQEIPKSRYLEYEPLAPARIVGQTRASEMLHLFGDPADTAFRDSSPRDGVDDRRHDLLLALAVRFAPYMVENTTNIPMAFQRYITRGPAFPLYIDTWDVAAGRGRLLRTQIVDFAALANAPCGAWSACATTNRPSVDGDD